MIAVGANIGIGLDEDGIELFHGFTGNLEMAIKLFISLPRTDTNEEYCMEGRRHVDE
ncbi:hypothetical protein PGH44_00070 [Legionella pneumophila]|nr:hypothetical protein PGH44_00070 [Legionella pneumophila]